jgi:hypothetical protein
MLRVERRMSRLNIKRKAIFVALMLILVICLGGVALAQASSFESCDQTGTTVDVFRVGDQVYAKGAGLPNGAQYLLKIVIDKDEWHNGDQIPATVVAPTPVTATGGNFGPTLIWNNAVYGQYDVVADRTDTGTGIGYYNRVTAGDQIDNDDVALGFSANTAGLVVLPEYALGGLAALAACFAGFAIYKKRSNLSKLGRHK